MSTIELYEAMSTLRAVRRLRSDPIPDPVLRRVLLAATWAPSGGNRQPWRIVAVRDREKVARLGEMYRGVWKGYADQSRTGLEGRPDSVRGRWDRILASGDYLAENFADCAY